MKDTDTLGGNTLAKLEKEAMKVLKETSRTFYIPITLLKKELRLTVGSAYLCMRAIDEIEDHETMEPKVKSRLLRETASLLEKGEPFERETYEALLKDYQTILPEVTLRLADWLAVCPEGILYKVKESTAEMARGMAKWVDRDFLVETKEDLDEYTYYVAGLVGVMLSDIWAWYDGTETSREKAIGFGRGLQAVNILRNQDEDLEERGVSFVPDGWTRADLFDFARHNLALGDSYIEDIKTKNIVLFCKIPLALAKRTLAAMEGGKRKMSRQEVEEVVADLTEE